MENKENNFLDLLVSSTFSLPCFYFTRLAVIFITITAYILNFTTHRLILLKSNYEKYIGLVDLSTNIASVISNVEEHDTFYNVHKLVDFLNRWRKREKSN